MNIPILSIEELSKKYYLDGKKDNKNSFFAVDEVSFDVFEGEALGIIGESGSGKTTLIRMIMGIEKPTSGTIYSKGEELTQKRPISIKKEMQIVYQDSYSSLDPRMKIKEILSEPLIIQQKQLSKKDIDKMVNEVLEKVNIPKSYLTKFPHELSGGERQRINIARALIGEPKIIICDEPTSSLDVTIQAQILNLLKQLRNNMKITILFVSHDMGVVRFISNKILVMQKGKIVERGTVSEVIDNPKHQYTQQLIKSVPKINFDKVIQ